jgi:FdhE protein
MEWLKGYCPICGSMPEMSFLDGAEGQRWLKCSLCGYDWRFDRMTCPYCEKKTESKELISAEGFEHEWIDLCPHCNKYIVSVDFRNQEDVTTEVAGISMVYLDIIAQQKGFAPIAVCAWNMILADK